MRSAGSLSLSASVSVCLQEAPGFVERWGAPALRSLGMALGKAVVADPAHDAPSLKQMAKNRQAAGDGAQRCFVALFPPRESEPPKGAPFGLPILGTVMNSSPWCSGFTCNHCFQRTDQSKGNSAGAAPLHPSCTDISRVW